MEQQIIKQQIASCLESLREQYEMIKNRDGKTPQIEIDILLNNTRNFYETLLHLNKLNNDDVIAPVLTPAEEIKNDVVAEIKSQQAGVIAEEKISDSPVEQKIIEERTKVISRAQKPAVKSGSLFEDVTIMADTFEEKETIHTKISRTKDETSIADRLSNMPLQDLKKSIGINEKFKFVNELFDGDLQEYNSSIDALNLCGSFEETENFIAQNLIPKYSWKKESGVYQSLLFLIQRKFNY
ncbi:MAG: hypothetical protein ACHQNT_09025 [Bacteroidia bacterium]